MLTKPYNLVFVLANIHLDEHSIFELVEGDFFIWIIFKRVHGVLCNYLCLKLQGKNAKDLFGSQEYLLSNIAKKYKTPYSIYKNYMSKSRSPKACLILHRKNVL